MKVGEVQIIMGFQEEEKSVDFIGGVYSQM